MGFLELDGNPVKDDNMLQRLFWPSDHAGEAEYLGIQGFWICVAIAVVSSIALLVRGSWIVAPLVFFFYLLGGIGVREHSVVAAVLVASDYWIEKAFNLSQGQSPGLSGLAAGVLLIANIRETWIAAKWMKQGDPEAFPERRNSTFFERFADRMPARVWPGSRIPFYIVAGIYMLLVVLGVAVTLLRPPLQHPVQQTDGPQQIEVTPTR
jgi:hypothetical protein